MFVFIHFPGFEKPKLDPLSRCSQVSLLVVSLMKRDINVLVQCLTPNLYLWVFLFSPSIFFKGWKELYSHDRENSKYVAVEESCYIPFG